MEYLSDSVDKTIALGKWVGERLTGGEFISLVGDLGGGKTHFTKGLAQGLGVTEEITSPTFVIERIYPAGELELHHFDFYRLAGHDGEIESDIAEILKSSKNIVVAEWAENLPKIVLKENLRVTFHYLGENKRKLILTPKNKKTSDIIRGWK